MGYEKALYFRRPNGVVFRMVCHFDHAETFVEHYTKKGFTLLPGDPGDVVIKGDTAPEPEPKPESMPEAAPKRKRGMQP